MINPWLTHLKVTAVVRSAHLIGDRTAHGFAVLKADGGVVAWGHPSYGGDSAMAKSTGFYMIL